MTEEKKKSKFTKSAFTEAKKLVSKYRRRLALGLSLMVFGRLAGMVLPASSKYLIDEVVGNSRVDLLPLLGVAVGAATVIQAFTTFALSQLISVAAQKAIMDVRETVQRQVIRLPVARLWSPCRKHSIVPNRRRR